MFFAARTIEEHRSHDIEWPTAACSLQMHTYL